MFENYLLISKITPWTSIGRHLFNSKAICTWGQLQRSLNLLKIFFSIGPPYTAVVNRGFECKLGMAWLLTFGQNR